MKLGGIDLPGLPALPALKLPRLPLAAFRRRLVVRGVFVLLMLATVALALVLLAEERQRSRQRYEAGFQQRLATIAERLRHPTGQLALLNVQAAPALATRAAAEGMVPLVLPFSALDFDDPFKARQAVEMSGCAWRWADGRQLCVAVGRGAYAGGFVYLVASFDAPPALARERGGLSLQTVSHAAVRLASPDGTALWVAPFEAAADAPVLRGDGGLRGRLPGFAQAEGRWPIDVLDPRARPDRDFRAWLWQDAQCTGGATTPDCVRPTLLSIRVPVAAWRDALVARRSLAWPPEDLRDTRVALQWRGADGQVVFDSAAEGGGAPFALVDLVAQLEPRETLHIERLGAPVALASLRGPERAAVDERSAPWLLRVIERLPLAGPSGDAKASARIEANTELVLAGQPRLRLVLTGDGAASDQSLGATATRLAWFLAAMLGAIAAAWLVIEIGFMRRMALLTRRAAALSWNLQDPQLERRLGELEVADLRGPDELGILAGSLSELLQRVKDGARREHLRAEQEREQWHAVGHEIMSPLQSLMVLHGRSDDPSHRYVQRMQQAVRVLYGTASPSEAIAQAHLAVQTLSLDDFVRQVAANASFAGLHDVRLDEPAPGAWLVHADEYSLEDVVTHVLGNADRHRLPGTPITLSLAREAHGACCLRIHNQGEPIAASMLERIFEYGVSGDGSVPADGATVAARTTSNRGQGLFVARTYMAKMGGTIHAANVEGGVVFELRLMAESASGRSATRPIERANG